MRVSGAAACWCVANSQEQLKMGKASSQDDRMLSVLTFQLPSRASSSAAMQLHLRPAAATAAAAAAQAALPALRVPLPARWHTQLASSSSRSRSSTTTSSSSSSSSVPALRRVSCAAGFGGFGLGKGAGGSAGGKSCPCGSGQLYTSCCQRYHKSSSLAAAAPSPEALIRARYSAFVKKDVKFLRATSHPDNPALKGSSTAPDAEVERQCSFEEDLAVTFVSIEFLGLQILGSSVGGDGASASVDVCVSLKRRVDETGKRVAKPATQEWRERALLVREPDEGRWLVLDVQQLGGGGGAAAEPAAGAAAAAT